MGIFSRSARPRPSAAPSPAPGEGQDAATGPGPPPRGRSGWIVAVSLVTGFVAALVLPAMPFVPVEESALTGALLCGFAVG